MKKIQPKNRHQSGITLIEFIMVIAAISIISGWGLPALDHQLKLSKLRSEQQQLISLINTARITAIDRQQKVTICPSTANNQCSDNWSSGYLAFIDLDGDRRLGEKESILFQFRTTDSEVKIKWRAFGHQKTLQWLPSGITNHQNGSFEICLNQDPQYARALVLSKMGRLRRTDDSNHNGIHENAQGVDLNCQ